MAASGSGSAGRRGGGKRPDQQRSADGCPDAKRPPRPAEDGKAASSTPWVRSPVFTRLIHVVDVVRGKGGRGEQQLLRSSPLFCWEGVMLTGWVLALSQFKPALNNAGSLQCSRPMDAPAASRTEAKPPSSTDEGVAQSPFAPDALAWNQLLGKLHAERRARAQSAGWQPAV